MAPERQQLGQAIDLIKSQPSQAVKELERLADSGSQVARRLAMRNLALAYRNGAALGAPDLAKAEMWYRCAVDEGYRPAEFELGQLLRETGQYDRALDVLKQSAAIGYAPSMRLIGTMHSQGEGVVRDLTQVRRWWERAIERGNVWAKRKLASTMLRREYGWSSVPLGLFLFLSALTDATGVILTRGANDVRLK